MFRMKSIGQLECDDLLSNERRLCTRGKHSQFQAMESERGFLQTNEIQTREDGPCRASGVSSGQSESQRVYSSPAASFSTN